MAVASALSRTRSFQHRRAGEKSAWPCHVSLRVRLEHSHRHRRIAASGYPHSRTTWEAELVLVGDPALDDDACVGDHMAI